jgi:uncharacterized membrane protein YhaH (DUF805 family)
VSPTDAVTRVLTHFVDFSGRASRSEYWWWTGALFLAYLLAGLLVIVEPTIGLLVSAILLFGAFIPNLAVTVRRLHDVGRTGWWLLLHIIPFGSLVIFIFTLLDTERGMNRWGAPAVGSSYVDPRTWATVPAGPPPGWGQAPTPAPGAAVGPPQSITKVFTGPTTESAEAAFRADLSAAAAGGYYPVAQRWDTSQPQPTLVVEYGPQGPVSA